MTPQKETAATTGIVDGGVGSKSIAPFSYQICSDIATCEYAAAKVAARFRLTISTSREICRMAGLAVNHDR